MEPDLEELRVFAASLARGAGEVARREAAQVDVDGAADTYVASIESKGVAGDLVTRVDREVERRLVHGITARYRDHAVLGEESGHHGPADARVRWLVDPLDGTNNFVIGLELYGVCLTVLIDDDPVVAVVHDSVSGRTSTAVKGRGAELEGRPLRVADPRPLPASTVSWVQGYGVAHDDRFRRHAFDVVEGHCKRMLRTWSPSVDWALLARGGTDALVSYRNEPWDQAGGILLVLEAGGVRRTFTTADGHDCHVVGIPATVDALVDLLTT